MTDTKAELRSAQLALLQEKARAAKATADMVELKAMQLGREEKHFSVTDDLVHEHCFIGAVDSQNVSSAAQHLAFWHRLDPTCAMNIQMHSGGGSALAGINLFDQLTAYSERGGGQHKLTITIRGVAASMAGVLVQAADDRVIGPRSFLMVHELSGQTGGKIGEMEDTMEFYRQLNSDIRDLFVERSGGKCSQAEFDALWTRKDKWLTAEQAVAFGFVDRIG